MAKEDEVDAQVEYEEEYDEERPTGPKRKKRKKTNTLIDLEAEEDDQDDEDEEEDQVQGLIADDDDNDAPADREREHMRAQRLEQQRVMRSEDPEAMERYFRERFGDENDVDEEEEAGAPDTSGIDQQSLLPTIHDPRLYIVRCKKPGHERRAILSLLQKNFNLRRKGIDIGIFSAVAAEHLKGRVYIEAISAQHVERALNGLDIFSTYDGVKPLRLDEMTDVLKVAKKKDKLVDHAWVRMTRGIYKGDLAQVCGVREGAIEGHVMVRMIPRLDLKGEKDVYMEDEQFEYEDLNDKNGPRRRGRPPQRLFDKKELYRLTGSADVYTQRDQQTLKVFDVWNEDRYSHGLLYKKVSPRTLVTGDQVNPLVEELDKWLAAESKMKMIFNDDPTSVEAAEAAQGLHLDIGSIAGRKGAKLFKGDAIKVVSGEQKGLAGTISAIDGNVVMIQAAGVPMTLKVDRGDIVKTFTVGDNIKVTSGKRAGYSGTIVRLDGDVLTVFTDSTREEIRVLSSQVADASDVNTEIAPKTSALYGSMQYELFDLVQMLSDHNEYGVVTQVRTDGVTILTAQNVTRVVPVGDIRGKRRDPSVRAIDSRGNPIAPNDTIHVITGPQKDRQGVVKHLAGSTVFFKARDEINHCGIVAVPSLDCTASTAAARRPTMTLRQSGMAPQFKMPAPVPRAAVATGGRQRPPPSKIRDELYRVDVKIRRGQYKGHVGKVIDVTDTKVRVELTTKMKTVTLSREHVKPLNGTNVANGASNGNGSTSSFSRIGTNRLPAPSTASSSYSSSRAGASSMGRTPRHDDRFESRTPHHPGNYGSKTPKFGGFGSQTPRYGGANTPRVGAATPGAFGVATPGRDTFGRTPARNDGYGDYRTPLPNTPAADMTNPFTPFDIRTPAVPQTPLGADYPAVEPQTPAGLVEPNTPAYGIEPPTPAPGGLEPQTPAPGGMEPRTPAPGLEPKTPAPGFEPSTPMVQEPQTPHNPAGPNTPRPPEEDAAGLGYRVLIDVEVLVEGTFNGVVVDATADGSRIMVRMLTGDRQGKTIQVQEITPVQPRAEVGERQERVKVLDGAHVNRVGRLQHVDRGTNDGLIKFDNGDEARLQMSWVAKVYEEGVSREGTS